jgi:tetratricopeptide (TPR) repeat protein
MNNLVVYKHLKLKDCLKMPSDWDKIAWFRYSGYQKKALKEEKPAFNTLMVGLIQGVYAKDRSFIDKAAELVKDNMKESDILSFTGVALCSIGYQEEGLENVRKAVELNRSHLNIIALIGELDEQYSEEKLKLCQEVLDTNPNDVDAIRGIAAAHIYNKKFEEAERYILKALKINPKDWRVRQTYGGILYSQEKYLQALKEFKKAYWLSFNFRSKYLWEHFAHIYYYLGKYRKAKKAALKLKKIMMSENIDISKTHLKELLEELGIPL